MTNNEFVATLVTMGWKLSDDRKALFKPKNCSLEYFIRMPFNSNTIVTFCSSNIVIKSYIPNLNIRSYQKALEYIVKNTDDGQ